ncbi:MAG: tetratricopeptide repeat protein [Planctomycetota bacterium]|jgi:tetratricopeptide (TPR) repeat protein
MKSSYRCVPAICLAVGLAGGGASAVDTVILKSEKTFTGKVMRDDARGVALRSPGSPEFARADVREVVYDDGRPAEYALGREAARDGRHADAARLLREALDAPHHALLEQYILLHLARAEERVGSKGRAKDAFGKLAAKGARTRFLFEALDGLVRLGVKVTPPGPDAGLTETHLALLGAAVHEAAGRHGRALGLFGRAARLAAPGTELARRAELGSAGCLVRLGKGAEAAKRLRVVLRSDDDAHHAEAYVILGDALAAGAGTPDEWRAAAFAYLRVPVHHPGDPATEVPALKGAARCFRQVPERGAARAAKLEDFLKKRYPRAAGKDRLSGRQSSGPASTP